MKYFAGLVISERNRRRKQSVVEIVTGLAENNAEAVERTRRVVRQRRSRRAGYRRTIILPPQELVDSATPHHFTTDDGTEYVLTLTRLGKRGH